MSPPRSIVFVRHGRSEYNVTRRLNGDPAVPVALDDVGVAQVEALRPRIEALPIDLGVHTRLARTRQTLDILLAGRDVPRRECPGLDDVVLGEFEGADIDDYRAWREDRGDDARPRGGESRIDVLRRYTVALGRLAQTSARLPLVVTHDIPIRFLSNAMRGEDPLHGPVTSIDNASMLVVSHTQLVDAIRVMTGVSPRGAG